MTEQVKEELSASGATAPETEVLETAPQQSAGGTARREPVLGEPTRRRRTAKVDTVLAEAKDVALAGLGDIAPESAIGPVHHLRGEEERLTTHLFECTLPGYRGWFWFATLSRAPRSKVATVCEIGLLPGDDALLAPAWVPWADRVLPEDHENHDDYDFEDETTDLPESGEDEGAEGTEVEGS